MKLSEVVLNSDRFASRTWTFGGNRILAGSFPRKGKILLLLYGDHAWTEIVDADVEVEETPGLPEGYFTRFVRIGKMDRVLTFWLQASRRSIRTAVTTIYLNFVDDSGEFRSGVATRLVATKETPPDAEELANLPNALREFVKMSAALEKVASDLVSAIRAFYEVDNTSTGAEKTESHSERNARISREWRMAKAAALESYPRRWKDRVGMVAWVPAHGLSELIAVVAGKGARWREINGSEYFAPGSDSIIFVDEEAITRLIEEAESNR